MSRNAYVYILANQKRGTLYTGVTSNLARRLHQHRHCSTQGFTSRYEVSRLVWFTHGTDISAAIALEKKIKNRGRQWKIDLIEEDNPEWDDLATSWTNPESYDCAQDDEQRAADAMKDLTFRIADPIADRAALIELNIAHVAWVFSEIEKQSGLTARDILGAEPADYVPTIIDKVCGDAPPRGVFYLVEQDGQALAMGGLRHSGEGIAELKRVFVRPSGRGRRLGEAITLRLIADARAFGYRSVRLDTLPFMHTAQALYESLGFVDCAPYPIEMPEAFRSGIRYMALEL